MTDKPPSPDPAHDLGAGARGATSDASGFTPGPWELYNEDLRGGQYWVVAIPGPDFETIDLHADENGEANARLIAAAPDLYAALKEFDRLMLIIVSAVHHADPLAEPAVRDLVKAARAALAKIAP